MQDNNACEKICELGFVCSIKIESTWEGKAKVRLFWRKKEKKKTEIQKTLPDHRITGKYLKAI